MEIFCIYLWVYFDLVVEKVNKEIVIEKWFKEIVVWDIFDLIYVDKDVMIFFKWIEKCILDIEFWREEIINICDNIMKINLW